MPESAVSTQPILRQPTLLACSAPSGCNCARVSLIIEAFRGVHPGPLPQQVHGHRGGRNLLCIGHRMTDVKQPPTAGDVTQEAVNVSPNQDSTNVFLLKPEILLPEKNG